MTYRYYFSFREKLTYVLRLPVMCTKILLFKLMTKNNILISFLRIGNSIYSYLMPEDDVMAVIINGVNMGCWFLLFIMIRKNDLEYHLVTLHHVAFWIFIKKVTSSSVLLGLKQHNATSYSVLLC